MHPKSEGLLESSLYVDDVARAALFYEKIFGFRVISDFGERGCAMQAGERQVTVAIQKGRFALDRVSARRRRRAACRFRSFCFGAEDLGSMAGKKRNLG
jgi:catechol 2,3-dioxygenase-like lactoylglutathione lyase family enzyme